MTAAFDTLAAARDMERAGLKREAAEAVAAAIRAGQGELATRATQIDLSAMRNDIAGLRRLVGINITVGLATLAVVLAIAFRP